MQLVNQSNTREQLQIVRAQALAIADAELKALAPDVAAAQRELAAAIEELHTIEAALLKARTRLEQAHSASLAVCARSMSIEGQRDRALNGAGDPEASALLGKLHGELRRAMGGPLLSGVGARIELLRDAIREVERLRHEAMKVDQLDVRLSELRSRVWPVG